MKTNISSQIKIVLFGLLAAALLLVTVQLTHAQQPLKDDYGDLPLQYNNTLDASNGAAHEVNGLRLGTLVDPELDGFPSSAAAGDDLDFNDDEDGIAGTPNEWEAGANGGSLTVTVSGGTGCLSAWIDFNNNNQFDANEQIFNAISLTEGVHELSFDIPELNETAYARFRLAAPLDNGQCVSIPPNGWVFGGEVEDYFFIFADTTAVSLSSTTTSTASISTALLIVLAGLGVATVAQVRKEA